MGDTCTPIADSCQCMAKPLQYSKVISLQLNKLIFKRKEKEKQGAMLTVDFPDLSD